MGPLTCCLVGHSTPVRIRRYASSYNAETAARVPAKWSPGDRLARRRVEMAGYQGRRGMASKAVPLVLCGALEASMGV